MMPDGYNDENARSDFKLDEPVGRIGNLYTEKKLSPPTQLRHAAKHWLGLSHEEISAAIERHFDEHRRLYTCGSGGCNFWMVEAEIRRTWLAKHPPRDRAGDDPVPPQRERGIQQTAQCQRFSRCHR